MDRFNLGTSESWKNASSVNPWSYTSSFSFSDGENYLITSRATDNASNVESPGVGVGNTWTYDLTAPVSVVTIPTDGENTNSLTIITGTSTSDTSLVKLSIKIHIAMNTGQVLPGMIHL